MRARSASETRDSAIERRRRSSYQPLGSRRSVGGHRIAGHLVYARDSASTCAPRRSHNAPSTGANGATVGAQHHQQTTSSQYVRAAQQPPSVSCLNHMRHNILIQSSFPGRWPADPADVLSYWLSERLTSQLVQTTAIWITPVLRLGKSSSGINGCVVSFACCTTVERTASPPESCWSSLQHAQAGTFIPPTERDPICAALPQICRGSYRNLQFTRGQRPACRFKRHDQRDRKRGHGSRTGLVPIAWWTGSATRIDVRRLARTCHSGPAGSAARSEMRLSRLPNGLARVNDGGAVDGERSSPTQFPTQRQARPASQTVQGHRP